MALEAALDAGEVAEIGSSATVSSGDKPAARPSKQAGQLPAGPSPESFAPHCGHVFASSISRFNWPPLLYVAIRSVAVPGCEFGRRPAANAAPGETPCELAGEDSRATQNDNYLLTTFPYCPKVLKRLQAKSEGMMKLETQSGTTAVVPTSKSAVSRVSKPALSTTSPALPIWKSAIQQVWKPAIFS